MFYVIFHLVPLVHGELWVQEHKRYFQGKIRWNRPKRRHLAYLARCQVAPTSQGLAPATIRWRPPEGGGTRHPHLAKSTLPCHRFAASLSQASTTGESKSVWRGQLREITQGLCSTSTSKWQGWHVENVTPTWGTASRSKQEPSDRKAVASSGARHFGHGVRHWGVAPATLQSSHSAPVTSSLQNPASGSLRERRQAHVIVRLLELVSG